jgi:hypothetical protein
MAFCPSGCSNTPEANEAVEAQGNLCKAARLGLNYHMWRCTGLIHDAAETIEMNEMIYAARIMVANPFP